MTTITTPDQLRALYDPVRERSAAKELPQLDAHATRFMSRCRPLSWWPPAAWTAWTPRRAAARLAFVKVLDAHTLLIPDSPATTGWTPCRTSCTRRRVGPAVPGAWVDETLRVNGTAVLSVDAADLRAVAKTRGACPSWPSASTVQASYLHCAKALMRSELWNPAHHQPRTCMPSMGEMLRDQVADKVTPGTVFENAGANAGAVPADALGHPHGPPPSPCVRDRAVA
jgi:predicted pyridoxine 5'-phosphate oxidase superfamily flavin-nucleotide-binding protein